MNKPKLRTYISFQKLHMNQKDIQRV